MTRITKGFLLVALLSVLTALSLAQGVYNAASCNYSDVNAVINGPTHIAVNGDTIIIPTGTCTWTSNLSISVGITLTGSGIPNTGPSSFGSGTLNTVIVDNAGSSSPLVKVSGISYGQTFTLALLDVEPNSSGTALWSPVSIAGTCTASGCPNVRVDNIGFGLTTQWNENGNSSNADWMIRTDNVFGVIDHCTLPNNSSVELFNANHSAYLGVGGYGDNSWAQPDSFGTGNALYAENNVVYLEQAISDCDVTPAGGGTGGCRVVGRFNRVTFEQYNFAFMIVHGLDTGGRMRSGRQQEAYNNTVSCPTTSGCSSLVGFRGGTGFVFGNTMSASGGGFYNNVASITVYRTVFTAGGGWGACGGSSPYDSDDGVVYYSGTNSGSSGSITLTDSTKSWTPNQFIPNGAPYSVYDVTQGWWAEIANNTATTLTIQTSIPEQNNLFNNGDSYQILRATVCADQGGRGSGNYVSGPMPVPANALNQALDPIYEWMDSVQNLNHGVVGTDTGRTVANRDWYAESQNQGAQTTPTSPFNGTSGTGHGTLANRPTTCTPRVGYWATDQGNWNNGGSGGQGELFVCTAPNTWTLYYTPYTYPHPLTQGGPPGPPTNLQAIPQ